MRAAGGGQQQLMHVAVAMLGHKQPETGAQQPALSATPTAKAHLRACSLLSPFPTARPSPTGPMLRAPTCCSAIMAARIMVQSTPGATSISISLPAPSAADMISAFVDFWAMATSSPLGFCTGGEQAGQGS